MGGSRLFDDRSAREREKRESEARIRAVLKAARAKAEKQLGHPIPADVWEYLDEVFGGNLAGEEDANAYAEAIPDYIGIIAAWKKGAPPTVREAARTMRRRRSAPTPKALARNMEILWFVTERVVRFVDALQGNLHTSFRRGPRVAGTLPPWDLLCREWNGAHPNPLERFTSGESLRHQYGVALRDDNIREAFLQELKGRQAAAVLQRLCPLAFGLRPESVGMVCLLDFPSVRANPPADIREVLHRADNRPSEVARLLGITEDEWREKAAAARAYLREQMTEDDRLAWATVNADAATQPLLAPMEEEPKLKLCGWCLSSTGEE